MAGDCPMFYADMLVAAGSYEKFVQVMRMKAKAKSKAAPKRWVDNHSCRHGSLSTTSEKMLVPAPMHDT